MGGQQKFRDGLLTAQDFLAINNDFSFHTNIVCMEEEIVINFKFPIAVSDRKFEFHFKALLVGRDYSYSSYVFSPPLLGEVLRFPQLMIIHWF